MARPPAAKAAIDELRSLSPKPSEISLEVSTLAQEDVKDAQQNRQQRRVVQWKVFGTLWGELVVLFTLIFFQGFHCWGFNLNEWTFGLFVNGCLVQTFLVIRFVVQYLFPQESPAKRKSEKSG